MPSTVRCAGCGRWERQRSQVRGEEEEDHGGEVGQSEAEVLRYTRAMLERINSSKVGAFSNV